VVSSAELEERLAPAYRALKIQPGQLEAMTGIVERRFWEPGYPVSRGAAEAAQRAIERSALQSSEIEALLYCGVCREDFEPATACDVAALLAEAGTPVNERAAVHDLGNACLGVISGILDLANRIELGQIRAGMVVSCESAREIVDLTISRMLEDLDMETFRYTVATLTGGSGAVAVIVSDGSFGSRARRIVGGVQMTAPEHHRLCRWGVERSEESRRTGATHREYMRTDSVAVLEHGVALGVKTWNAFLTELEWSMPDRVVSHQVGAGHRAAILRALDIPEARDFVAYDFLGNTGTVALPLAAALAEEREFLRPNQRVGLLGIGSGLNCMMLGVEW
jgi:3-oxoacyl-[acyl-carrier-protein] synthase-3